MSKNLEEITKRLRDPNYGINPMGTIIDVPWGGDVKGTIKVSKSIHKIDKKAMKVDMTPSDQEFLDDVIGKFMRLCRTNLLFLGNKMMGFEYIRPEYPFCMRVAKFLAQEALRMMLLEPRWHLKTTFLAVFIVQNLLNNFENTWMIKSGVWGNAQQILKLIYYRLLTEEMRNVWGDLRGDTYSFTAIDLSYRKPSEQDRVHNIDIAGAQSETTGQHYTNGGFDDLSGEKNSETIEQCDKAWDDYENKILLIDNMILQTCTRWHSADVPGRIIEQNPRIRREKPHLAYKILHEPVYNDLGEPIFPEIYDHDWVENKRVELAAFRFSAQMLLKPISSEDQTFKEEWLKPWYFKTYTEIKDEILNIYIMDDPASSKARHADRTSIIVVGVSPTFHLYIMDERTGKFNTIEHINHIFDLIVKWRDFKIGDYKPKWTFQRYGIEQGTYEKTFKPFLRERMEKTGIIFSPRLLKPGNVLDAKKKLIRGLQPYAQMGMLHILEILKQYQSEIIGYGAGRYDDRANATAYIFQMGGIKPKEVMPEEKKTRFQKHHERNLRKFRRGGRRRDFINQGVRG